MIVPLEIGRSALVIMDMQRDILDDDGVLARLGFRDMSAEEVAVLSESCRYLAAVMRQAGRPVVFVTTTFHPDYADCALPLPWLDRGLNAESRFLVEGTRGAELVDGLRPEAGDHLVVKKGLSAFQHTFLDRLLANLGVDQCVLAGGLGHSISSTARMAALLHYAVFVAQDAVPPRGSASLDTFKHRAEFVSAQALEEAAHAPAHSSREGGPGCALVIVDMQNELLKGDPDASEDENLQRLIANNRELMAAMRELGWPVVLAGGARRPDLLDDARSRVAPVMHARPAGVPYRQLGSWGAQFLEGLQQQPSDIVVEKKGNSAFGFTPLHRILRNIGVRRCLVTGGAVSGCVSDTIREGIGLGYEMTMVSDAAYPLNAPYSGEIAELGQVRTTEDVLQELRVGAGPPR